MLTSFHVLFPARFTWPVVIWILAGIKALMCRASMSAKHRTSLQSTTTSSALQSGEIISSVKCSSDEERLKCFMSMRRESGPLSVSPAGMACKHKPGVTTEILCWKCKKVWITFSGMQKHSFWIFYSIANTFKSSFATVSIGLSLSPGQGQPLRAPKLSHGALWYPTPITPGTRPPSPAQSPCFTKSIPEFTFLLILANCTHSHFQQLCPYFSGDVFWLPIEFSALVQKGIC